MTNSFMLRCGLCACVALAACILAGVPAKAQYKTVYSFTGAPDGSAPESSLMLDSAGDLVGTSVIGGASNLGTIFKIDPAGNETVIYSFTGGSDGGKPFAELIQDSQGSFYGTASIGGAHNNGTVFKLDASGNFTVLYAFTGGSDGGTPYAGLVRDSQGNLYGATEDGGSTGSGVVFKIDTSGNESVVYSFAGGSDGAYPESTLIRDSQGNLYGTTYDGGIFDKFGDSWGVVFKVDATGHESVLYAFSGGADGSNPNGGLVRDSQGNLYGTTVLGGGSAFAGVIFKLDTSGNETVLHNFTDGADGGYPIAALIIDGQGNLYGTTPYGGSNDNGVVFKLDTSNNESVLHTFTGTPDGSVPDAGVLQDSQGDLFGTASVGGSTNQGAVFEITASQTGPVPTSLTFNPNPVTGGNSAIGTVTISAPAPPGLSVTLSSADPSVVQVPASIAFATGATSATFTATTSVVTVDTTVAISASCNGTTIISDLTVTNRTIKSVKVKPKAVKGGHSATGTVILTTSAPAGGAVVSLSSSNAAAQVPASVTVAAGQKKATFMITTSQVSQKTTVTITATYGGGSIAAKMTLKP